MSRLTRFYAVWFAALWAFFGVIGAALESDWSMIWKAAIFAALCVGVGILSARAAP